MVYSLTTRKLNWKSQTEGHLEHTQNVETEHTHKISAIKKSQRKLENTLR